LDPTHQNLLRPLAENLDETRDAALKKSSIRE
jgi:hypothetical protein